MTRVWVRFTTYITPSFMVSLFQISGFQLLFTRIYSISLELPNAYHLVSNSIVAYDGPYDFNNNDDQITKIQ